jgi:serine/threonine protein kinase/Flp pilus assembly protein TadD
VALNAEAAGIEELNPVFQVQSTVERARRGKIAQIDMELSAGTRLGPYEILAPLGAGGMGEVYRALDTRLNRIVAIKILPHDKLADANRKRRFLQEARAASALMHPNIVVIHDISTDSGVDFLVMEYVQGSILTERIKAGSLSMRELVHYGTQIARALASAHAKGIVHRDIKPANIIVTPDSQIKILDFGLAKLAEPLGIGSEHDTRTIAAVTEPGLIVGTVAYMSPEQTRGEPLDGRSDIFSLGCVLYEAATGKPPFQGPSTLAVMHQIATANPAAPSQANRDLPPEIDRVIGRALAKDKQERYGSAAELMEALQALESRDSTAISHPRRKSRGSLAVGSLLLVAAAVAVYYWKVPAKRHIPDPQAYQLYLQGRRNLQEFTEHGFKQSVVDFRNAIKRDPEYAAAYAGLADAYSYLAAAEFDRPKDIMPAAESSAAKSIEKDPHTAEAYTSLGIVALAYYWDYPLALQRFQRAIKLNPSDAFTQHFLGHYYELMGKWPEALRQMQRAFDLDKLSPMFGEDLAYDLLMNRRYEDAVRQLRETVGLAPEDPFAHALLALALEVVGNSRESLQEAEQAVKLPGMFAAAGSLGGVFCRLGQPGRAREILQQLEAAAKAGKYVAPLEIAMVHFALGDKTKGLAAMREAVNDHSFNLGIFISDPVFDLVRGDAEFAALMNEVHLPPAVWQEPRTHRK